MHRSLIPEYAAQLDTPLPPPPCPIVDFHMHVGDIESNREYERAAQAYGVERAVALLHRIEPEDLFEHFDDFFVPCAWATRDRLGGQAWQRQEIERLERWWQRGVRVLKYKITPTHGRPAFKLDDERLQPVLARAATLGLIVLAHIAEPSLWWPDRFVPEEVGDKASYFPQVEYVLREHPDLTFVGAHMGGYPERLDYLGELMDTHPNFYIDTSATKWVVRELSRQPDVARAFFLQHADRILFGSDLVVMFGDAFDYFTSRLHVQRCMWEGDAPMPCMIRDPDAQPPDFPHGPEIRPLRLPKAVLRQIYGENAERLLRTAERRA